MRFRLWRVLVYIFSAIGRWWISFRLDGLKLNWISFSTDVGAWSTCATRAHPGNQNGWNLKLFSSNDVLLLQSLLPQNRVSVWSWSSFFFFFVAFFVVIFTSLVERESVRSFETLKTPLLSDLFLFFFCFFLQSTMMEDNWLIDWERLVRGVVMNESWCNSIILSSRSGLVFQSFSDKLTSHIINAKEIVHRPGK